MSRRVSEIPLPTPLSSVMLNILFKSTKILTSTDDNINNNIVLHSETVWVIYVTT